MASHIQVTCGEQTIGCRVVSDAIRLYAQAMSGLVLMNKHSTEPPIDCKCFTNFVSSAVSTLLLCSNWGQWNAETCTCDTHAIHKLC
eukprot:1558693-Amphidinium_carterae.2